MFSRALVNHQQHRRSERTNVKQSNHPSNHRQLHHELQTVQPAAVNNKPNYCCSIGYVTSFSNTGSTSFTAQYHLSALHRT